MRELLSQWRQLAHDVRCEFGLPRKGAAFEVLFGMAAICVMAVNVAALAAIEP